MEAKDTVDYTLVDRKIRDYLGERIYYPQDAVKECIVGSIQSQAEISFRVGQQEIIETYQRENPSASKKYEEYWNIKRKERGL